MSKPTSYAEAPQEIRDGVEQLIRTYGPDPALLAGALVAATTRIILAAKAEEREACALLIEQGFDREGITTKNDKCPHGLYGWEDCEQCAVRAIRKRGEA